jgi:hypothetical protein
MKLMKGKGRRELVKPALFFSIAADGERFDGGGLAENEQWRARLGFPFLFATRFPLTPANRRTLLRRCELHRLHCKQFKNGASPSSPVGGEGAQKSVLLQMTRRDEGRWTYLPESEETDARDLDDLEPNSRDISFGFALPSEAVRFNVEAVSDRNGDEEREKRKKSK